MFTEHIRNALGAYKRNFLELFSASLILTFIATFISYFGEQMGTGALASGSLYMFLIFSPFLVILTAVSVILSAGIVKMCEEALKNKTSLHTLQTVFNAKWRTILFANIILVLIAFATLIPLFLLSAVPFAFLAGAVVWLLFMVLFSFVDQAIVLSNKKAIASIYLSFNAAKKKYVSILLLFAVLGIIFVVPIVLLKRYELLQTIVSTIISPLFSLAITSLYLSKK